MTAAGLLERNPQPVPRFRILRDILALGISDLAYLRAREEAANQKQVLEVRAAQLEDGTWGRFHSQDARVKQKFPTTEFAIDRCLALGLEKDDPVLERTVTFLEDHLAGKAQWSDRVEKHDHPMLWGYITSFITAANLALIDHEHPLLEEKRREMIEIWQGAFRSGAYRAEDEIDARCRLSGIRSKFTGFVTGKYALILLSCTRRELPDGLEDQALSYFQHKPDGIYYVYGKSLRSFPSLQSRHISDWLYAYELLSRFPGWRPYASPAMTWLWEQREEDGLWDFGSQVEKGPYFPLSNGWKRKQDRMIDCSVRVLSLLAKYVGPGPAPAGSPVLPR